MSNMENCESLDSLAYFSDDALIKACDACCRSQKMTLVSMKANDFLLLADFGYDHGKMRNATSLIESNIKFHTLPVLHFKHDGMGKAEVVGHDGRHRARALIKNGVSTLPVVMKMIGDRGRIKPSNIVSENNNRVLPFPQSKVRFELSLPNILQ